MTNDVIQARTVRNFKVPPKPMQQKTMVYTVESSQHSDCNGVRYGNCVFRALSLLISEMVPTVIMDY